MTKELCIIQPEGTLPTDETFSGEFTGTYNVSLLRRWILDGSLTPIPTNIAITQSWIDGADRLDTNPVRVAQVTQAECDANPILVIVDGPESGYIIDGAHRLRWLVDNHRPSFRAFVIPIDQALAHKFVLWNGLRPTHHGHQSTQRPLPKPVGGIFPNTQRKATLYLVSRQ